MEGLGLECHEDSRAPHIKEVPHAQNVQDHRIAARARFDRALDRIGSGDDGLPVDVRWLHLFRHRQLRGVELHADRLVRIATVRHLATCVSRCLPRRGRAKTRQALTGAVLLAAACGGSKAEDRSPRPGLVALDSIVLQESESAFVAEPSGFAIGPDGSFLIADRRNGVLHRFARDGRRLAAIGRRGPGPDEWSRGPFVVKVSESQVGVSDGSRHKTLAFPSGTVLSEASRPAGSSFLAMGGSAAFFRLIDRGARTTVERVVGSERVHGGPFTSMMGRSLAVDNMLSFLALVPLDTSRVAVMVQNSDFLYFGPLTGPFDSIAVPVKSRRGAMPELVNGVTDDDPASQQRAAYQPSYPFLLARTGDPSILALTSVDQTFASNRMTGRLWLSLVDLQRRRACSDASLTLITDPQPWVDVVGDTVFLLLQAVEPAGAPTTIVQAKRIDSSACWRD
ncbi:MAG: hypothetical protein IT361_09895 [Gemmatimonadaceae bacterium]|nr:hypothetical protein [Gemmatimonadaceae bacterium]